MHLNKRNLLDSLLIAAIIGLIATLARGADDSLSKALALEQRIKADAQAARLAQERQAYSVKSKNFIVAAVGRSFAEGALHQAEGTRRAAAWLYHKRAMADGEQFTIIQIEIDAAAEEECHVWLCGKGRFLRGDNRIWITTASKERAAELLEQAVEAIVRGGKPRVTERVE